MDGDVLSEVPINLQKLVQMVVRGFYTVEDMLIVDMLVRNLCKYLYSLSQKKNIEQCTRHLQITVNQTYSYLQLLYVHSLQYRQSLVNIFMTATELCKQLTAPVSSSSREQWWVVSFGYNQVQLLIYSTMNLIINCVLLIKALQRTELTSCARKCGYLKSAGSYLFTLLLTPNFLKKEVYHLTKKVIM